MEKKSLQYLVGEMLKQNEEAFNELYHRYYKLVYYIAFQLTKSIADADDILQETFLQVQKSIGDLKDPKQFKAWIGRITYSKSMKQFRKTRDFNLSDAQIQVMSNLVESRNEFLPDCSMRHDSDLVALHQCIGNLKISYREVLLLYYFAQQSIREIAQTLQIPEGTVKSRLLYGKKYLRTEIDGYQDESGEPITFKSSSLEVLLSSAGASLSTTSVASMFLPFKHISIPPTTMLLIAKVAVVTTLASGAVIGGYNIYEHNKESKKNQDKIINGSETYEGFPVIIYNKEEVTSAREAYEILLTWAHCEVEIAKKTKAEFMAVLPLFQALEDFGGSYQQLLHRNNWAEQFLKYKEI